MDSDLDLRGMVSTRHLIRNGHDGLNSIIAVTVSAHDGIHKTSVKNTSIAYH